MIGHEHVTVVMQRTDYHHQVETAAGQDRRKKDEV